MPILYKTNRVTLTEIVLPSSRLILLEKKEVMDATYVMIPFPTYVGIYVCTCTWKIAKL